MKNIQDIPHLEGVRVLVRVDFNVPMKNGVVSDDHRIRMALPTIDFLKKKGAKVILASHLEISDGIRNMAKKDDNLRTNGGGKSAGVPSLEPIAKCLVGLGVPVSFLKDFRKANGFIDNELKPGECVLLENLRFFEGEKANDKGFGKDLSSLADIYVNEAFSVSHREHASIVGLPKFLQSYAGLQFEREIANLSEVFHPEHPFLFILGGAKFETKLPLLEKFADIADTVFVGGALANDLYKEKGYEVGKSLVSPEHLDLKPLLNSPKLVLPIDVVNEKNETRAADGLKSDEKIVDAGPKTLESLKAKIASAKLILWNGPLGLYEGGYKGPTLELAKMIADRTVATVPGGEKESGDARVQSIVGGGDTLAAISELGIEDEFTFVSTGGGAMLEFLAKGTLPGIEALEKSVA